MQAGMEMLETLLDGVRAACAAFPDKRRGAVTYSMADIGLSAFSLFFMQSESFLAHQRALEEGRKMSNCQSLFGMTAVPTDNHIRAMLDPVHPSHLQPAFDAGSAGGISPPAAHRTVRKPLDLHGSSQPFACHLATTVDAERRTFLPISRLATTFLELGHPLCSTLIASASPLLLDDPSPSCP